MLFNSPPVIVFLVVVFCIYWPLRTRGAQNNFLLLASYIFYGVWSWKFLALLLASTTFDWFCGRAIAVSTDPRRRKRFLLFSVVANLSFLGFFKYYGFFATDLTGLLAAVGITAHPWMLNVALPVGISFYTFQSMSYVIDIYRGKLEAERSLRDFALYVAFFPHMVAGPIQRAHQLLAQVQRPRGFSGVAVQSGLMLLAIGLFKKVVIADNLAPYVNAVYADPTAWSGVALLTSTVFFAFQIYCDFGGYSDCARGIARLLGFELMVNFDLPYFSRNPVEFWRRWHISLSQWFQDYLYFPLAMRYMRKGGWASKYRAHIVSMTLIGFWHGANWTFVVFGFYWGVVLAAYLYIQEWLADRDSPPLGGVLARIPSWVKSLAAIGAMFIIACIGWVMFRAPSMTVAMQIIGGFFSTTGADVVVRADVIRTDILWTLIFSLVACEALWRVRQQIFTGLLRGNLSQLVVRHAVLAALLFMYFGAQQGKSLPFIYFQF